MKNKDGYDSEGMIMCIGEGIIFNNLKPMGAVTIFKDLIQKALNHENSRYLRLFQDFLNKNYT